MEIETAYTLAVVYAGQKHVMVHDPAPPRCIVVTIKLPVSGGEGGDAELLLVDTRSGGSKRVYTLQVPVAPTDTPDVERTKGPSRRTLRARYIDDVVSVVALYRYSETRATWVGTQVRIEVRSADAHLGFGVLADVASLWMFTEAKALAQRDLDVCCEKLDGIRSALARMGAEVRAFEEMLDNGDPTVLTKDLQALRNALKLQGGEIEALAAARTSAKAFLRSASTQFDKLLARLDGVMRGGGP
jgi:hypothetical protein